MKALDSLVLALGHIWLNDKLSMPNLWTVVGEALNKAFKIGQATLPKQSIDARMIKLLKDETQRNFTFYSNLALENECVDSRAFNRGKADVYRSMLLRINSLESSIEQNYERAKRRAGIGKTTKARATGVAW
jgi:hypothetical protein